MLACYCETLELYERCKSEVDYYGVLVEGRTPRERVRNPALTPLNQARADLIRLARAVPLANGKLDSDGASVDAFIDELMAK